MNFECLDLSSFEIRLTSGSKLSQECKMEMTKKSFSKKKKGSLKKMLSFLLYFYVFLVPCTILNLNYEIIWYILLLKSYI